MQRPSFDHPNRLFSPTGSIQPRQGPQRTLSTLDVICLILGLVIGAGIFKVPSIVASQSGSVGDFLIVWVLGGLISVGGALCYAELATSHPHAGGEYHWLSRAFGKHMAFFNLAYLSALGLDGMAASSAVVSDVFTLAFGKESAMIFSVIVILSCLNSLNATLIFGSRSNFAVGQDFRTFAWLGRWHGSGNPRNSLILQMLISLAVVGLAIIFE